MRINPSFVYSSAYDIRFFGMERLHPFDSRKYSRARRLMQNSVPSITDRFVDPSPARTRDLKAVHSDAYLNGSLKRSSFLASALEMPLISKLPSFLIDRRVLRPMRHATGGTILAAERAVAEGISINIGGGYHHAAESRAEGFCFYADIPIAIHRVSGQLQDKAVTLIDLDAHQGNGLARVFARNDQVSLFDMYNGDVFPQDDEAREWIRWNHSLRIGVKDREYLGLLQERLPEALDEAPPSFAVYNAGTDILKNDPLGQMEVSKEGVLQRDRFVFEELTKREIPWMMTTSGGYTDESHRLIAESLIDLWKRFGGDSDNA